MIKKRTGSRKKATSIVAEKCREMHSIRYMLISIGITGCPIAFLIHFNIISWMNAWMCIFIYRTYPISSHGGLQFLLDRTSACEGASGCHYQFIFNVTHPPNPCMKCRMKLEIDHHHFLQEIQTFMFTECLPKSSKRNKQSPLTKLEEKKLKEETNKNASHHIRTERVVFHRLGQFMKFIKLNEQYIQLHIHFSMYIYAN